MGPSNKGTHVGQSTVDRVCCDPYVYGLMLIVMGAAIAKSTATPSFLAAAPPAEKGLAVNVKLDGAKEERLIVEGGGGGGQSKDFLVVGNYTEDNKEEERDGGGDGDDDDDDDD